MKKFLCAPMLSTSFSRNGREAKKRFENIFDRSEKKPGKLAFICTLSGVLCCSLLTSCGTPAIGIIGGADGPTNIYVSSSANQTEADAPLEQAISSALLGIHDLDSYLRGECYGEGHVLLDSRKEGENTIVYVLATYGEYSFQNDALIKVSGSGVIPTKLTLDADLKLVHYETPEDGSRYTESLKALFPGTLSKIALDCDKYYDTCIAQERLYAQKYLDAIGRDAKIMEYSELDPKLPELEAKASNYLLDHYYDFPYWIGTEEKLEDGTRYVYQTEQFLEKPGISTITYTKKNYDTGEIVEQYKLHIDHDQVESADEHPLRS